MGRTRLLSIIGPSGLGKTRLAQVVMQDLAELGSERGFERIEFCNLVAAEQGSDVEAAIVKLLGPSRKTGPQLAMIQGEERGRRLLVLDNVDTLVAEVRPLAEALLHRHPELQILLTSISPLGLRQEVCFELGALEPEDAVQLYLDRTRRLRANQSSPTGELEAIEELVQRLDRIPLAIELAAARSTVLPPKLLLTQMDQRFDLLRSGKPGRHGSLYQALTLTWELLSKLEREALARASVFVGGFSLEAAEAILGGQGTDVVSLLDDLRAKAFLQLDESTEEPRFRPYESVRAYSALRLRDATVQEEESRQRHLEFFLREGEHHAARILGPEGIPSMQWLVAESENLLAAHRWARKKDPGAAARLGLVLAPILEFLGPHPAELEILDSAREAMEEAEDSIRLVRLAIHRGHALLRHGRVGDAKADAERSLLLAQKLGARGEEARLLTDLGLIMARSGEHAGALQGLHSALAIARELKDRDLEGRVLFGIGMVEESRSRFELSLGFLRQALVAYRQEGNLRMEAAVLFSMGATWSHGLEFALARESTEQARAIFQRIGDRAGESYVLANLGAIHLNAGRLEEAEELTKAGLRLEGAQGRPAYAAQAMYNLGVIAIERGDARLAEQQLLEAVSLYGSVGDRRHQARALCFVSAAEAALGRIEEARRSLEDARSFFAGIDDRVLLGAIEIFEGILDVEEGRQLTAKGTANREAERLRERAMKRRELASFGALPPSSMLALGLRLLERGLAFAATEAERAQPEAFTVGPEGKWFQPEGRERVDLRRRHALRGVLLGLVKHRLEAPGTGLDLTELFALGWQGEEIQETSASKRVYTAIWSLRSLGLSTALVHQGEGYMIDPSVTVMMSEGS